MVAMMCTYQPLFMGGIEDHKVSTSNAYGAMVMFIITFGVSVVYLTQDTLTSSSTVARRRRSGRDYEGVPTATDDVVMHDYAMNLDLPSSVHEGIYS